MLSERLVVLRNLVSLGQIGIEIILAGKDRSFVDPAIQSHGGEHREFDSLAIQDGQGAGKSQADRADIGVGRIAEMRGAGAKDLGRGQELDVNFEPDDRLVFREDLLGKRWNGRHGKKL